MKGKCLEEFFLSLRIGIGETLATTNQVEHTLIFQMCQQVHVDSFFVSKIHNPLQRQCAFRELASILIVEIAVDAQSGVGLFECCGRECERASIVGDG